MDGQTPLPQEGLLVVERAGRLAGGVCALLLRDLGARVVRFEAPDDPPPLALKGQAAANLAALLRAGRERVRYDAAAFAQALQRADVAIVAPVGAEAGPDLDAVRAHSKRLVGCVFTPYGMAGPGSDMPPQGDELTLQAISGAMATTGPEHGAPMANGVPLAELMAGVHGAVAVLAALRVRDRGDGGQLIDIAMFDALMGTMGSFMPLALEGRTGLRRGCRHSMAAPWNQFPTADGQVLICTTTDAQWRQLLRLAGREDCLDDPRFATPPDRVRHVKAVDALVGAWTAQRSSDEVISALDAVSVPAGAVRTIPELLRDESLRAQGMIREVRNEAGRACMLAGAVVNVAGSTLASAPLAVPPLQAQLPADIAEPPTRAAPARAARVDPPAPLPLAGIRVLDATLYTAGPLSARNLASLGAQVIKVEALDGEPCRVWTPARDGASLFFSNNNCDKRALALDLRSDEGRAVFAQLAARSDVLLENLRPGALERLGLGYAALREANPGLVYCSISGYGPRGANAGKAAYDTVIQAEGGLLSLLAGEESVKVGVSIADLMGASFAPLALLAALRLRERDGCGQRIDLSMQACTAWLTQLSWPAGEPGLPPWTSVRGADGFVLAQGSHGRIQAALGGADARTQPCAALVERLEATGLAAVRIRELAEVLAGEHVASRGLLRHVPNSHGHSVPALAPPYRLERTPARLERHMGDVGADTAAILGELGYTEADIAHLRAVGAIR